MTAATPEASYRARGLCCAAKVGFDILVDERLRPIGGFWGRGGHVRNILPASFFPSTPPDRDRWRGPAFEVVVSNISRMTSTSVAAVLSTAP